MDRLTHKRENGIKRGYWSPNKKQELVDRLAMYEDREEWLMKELEDERKFADAEEAKCAREDPLRYAARGYSNGVTAAITVIRGNGRKWID